MKYNVSLGRTCSVCAQVLECLSVAFLSPNDSPSIFSVLGKGMDGVAATWTYAQCGPRFQRHTAVTGTCFRYGHLGELRQGVHRVSRADAILVASPCPSPLDRQPQLSDKRYAHGQESFPRMVCVPRDPRVPHDDFRVLSTRFTELLAVSEDVGSHSVSAGNNAAENTRITSILPDMILVVGACHAILLWPPHFAQLVAFIPNLCGMHCSCCCWFARLPNTRGSQIGLPRASDVALFLCAGLHPCSFFCVECLCVALLAITRLSLDKGLGSYEQGCPFGSSPTKATASDPGTCWSAHRKRLRECGSGSLFRHT